MMEGGWLVFTQKDGERQKQGLVHDRKAKAVILP